MAQQIDIVANLLMKVDGAEAGINKLKNSLSKLKMPEGLENSFKKSFANLDVIFARYRSQVEKGFSTKADVTNFAKTGKALDAELDRISKHFAELTGKQVDFKVNSTEITKTEEELTKLIAQRNELAKSSIKFEITGAKEGYKDIESLLTKLKEVAGNTKTGQYASGALDFLKQGDLQSALVLLDKASVSCKRLNQDKQDLFSATGLDMSTAIKKIVEELTGAEGKFGNVNVEVTKLEQILADLRTGQIKDAGELAKRLADDMLNAGTAAKQANGAMQDFASSSFNMTQQLNQLQQSTQYFFGLRNMINLFKRGVKEAVQTVKDLDKAMTETAVVTQFDVSDMWEKLPEYTANANALGATIQDMYESTTLYYQQGLNTEQAMSIATETMKMARIAGMEAADATDMMTAALRGFNMEINETSAEHINDVYSNLAAKTASNTEELGTAMQRTASIAASAGMSFEGTAAFLAQAIETTREPAENLGTAMKTIVARFTELKKNPLEISEVDGEEVSYNKIDTALQSIGVSLKDANGQFRDLDKVFLDISEKWDSLTQTQQRYIATTAAGSRQQSRFIAMMSNYERTVELMDYANNSAGASQEQFGKTLDSLEAKINKFQNAWKEFLMGIMNDSWTKTVVDAGTKVLDVINSLTDALSFGGKLKGIKSILSLFTAFTGLRLAGRGINALIGGLGGMLDPTSSFKAGFKSGGIGGQAERISNPIVKAIYSLIPHIDKAASGLEKNQGFGNYKNANEAVKGLLNNGQKYSITGLQSIFEQNDLSAAQEKVLINSLPGLKNNLAKGLAELFNKAGAKPEVAKGLTAGIKKGTISLGDALIKGGIAETFSQRMGRLGKAEAESFKEGAINELAKNGTIGKIWEEAEAKSIEANKNGTVFDKAAYRDEQVNKELNKKVYIKDAYAVAAGTERLLTPAEQAANAFNKLGGSLSSTGMNLQMVGAQMSAVNPIIGAIISKIGGLLTAGGSLTSMIGSIVAGGPPMWILAGAITAIGTAFGVASIRASRAKKAAEQVVETYKQINEETQANISTLKQYQSEVDKWSQGVDQFGNNINLSDEDYAAYVEAVDKIAEINPSIVEGYNAQGHAIVNINKALSETLALEKQRQAEATKDYTSDEAFDKVLRARNLNDAYQEVTSSSLERDFSFRWEQQLDKWVDKKLDMHLFTKQTAAFSDDVNNIVKQVVKTNQNDLINILSDFNIDYDKILEGDALALNQFTQNRDAIYSRVLALYDGEMPQKVGKLFDALDEHAEAFDESTADFTQMLQTYVAGLDSYKNIPEEFRAAINKGLEYIAIQPDLNGKEAKQQAQDLIKQFNQLTSEGSKYSDIMTRVTEAQDEYAKSLSETEYTNAIQDELKDLDELYDYYSKKTDAYSQAVAEYINTQIEKIKAFPEEGAYYLTSALNEVSDTIAAANNIYSDFQEATKTDMWTGAKGMKSIYDDIFEGTHGDVKGDNTWWEGAERLLGKDTLKEFDYNIDKVTQELKKMGPELAEGEAGFASFWNTLKQADISNIANNETGVWWDENGALQIDTTINPDAYKHIADITNRSVEYVVAQLNQGRQYADINFISDPQVVRKALGADTATIKSTEDTEAGKAIYVTEDYLEQAIEQAGYNLGEVEGIKDFLIKNDGIRIIPGADTLTKKDFAKWNISDLPSLIKTFNDTGIFNKEQIEEYAKAYEGDAFDPEKFNTAYQHDLDLREDSTLAPIESIDSTVQRIANILDRDRIKEGDVTTDDVEQARIEWEQNTKGEAGVNDTAIQKFGEGLNEWGEVFSPDEFKAAKETAQEGLKAAQENWDLYKQAAQAAHESEDKVAEARANEAAGYWENIVKSYQSNINEADIKWAQAYAEKTQQDTYNSALDSGLSVHQATLESQDAYNEALQRAADALGTGVDNLATEVSELNKNNESTSTTDTSTTSSNIAPSTTESTYQPNWVEVGQGFTDFFGDITGVVTNLERIINPNITLMEGLAKSINSNNQATQSTPSIQGPTNQTATYGIDFVTTGEDKVEQSEDTIKDKADKGATHITKFEEQGAANIEKLTNDETKTTKVKVNADTSGIDAAGSKPIAKPVTIEDGTAMATINRIDTAAKKSITKTINVSPNYTGTWEKKIYVGLTGPGAKQGGYTGLNNKISYHHVPMAGSLAVGTKKGRLGPRNQGGMTLTGELGYEIAWLPSEGRSVILGANGPQMINLPKDATIYNHEQSKEIMKKRKSIDAGSMGYAAYTPSRNNWNFSSSSSRSSSKNSSSGSSGSSSSSSSNTTINHFSIEEVVRFNLDKKIEAMTSKIKKLTEEIDKNLKKIGTTALDITDSTQEQIKNLKSIKAFNDSLIASYQKDLNAIDLNKYMMKVSYTDDNGKSQDYTFDAQWYTYLSDGQYYINDSYIRQLGSPALQKAVYDAVKGLIDPLVSGLQKARDAADDAQKQIEDLAEKYADTFYGWENELTEIYNLTQRIENETSFTDRFASQIELELSRLGVGLGEVVDGTKDATVKAISNISAVLNRNNQTIKEQIEHQKQLMEARKRELDNALSAQDELDKIDAYRNSEAYTKASDEQRNAVITKLTDKYDIAANALAYVKNVTRELDGSVTYDIDWEGFEEAIRQNPLNEETYKAIKEYLDSLNDATTEYNGSIKDTTDLLKQTYDDLKKYQDTIVDFEGDLLKGVEEQIKNDTENAKKLSDSISNALKDLLDEVKRKLDERRKQEDNAKTERDIAQKQQRLAALRANTSGGNQVEIAQLEKEIADAQQSYGRTLEDQLLDKLQQQGDEAKLQRERQIELAEASNEINAANNKELVNSWLQNPELYKEQIKAAWLEAQGYDEKGFAEQDALLKQWDVEWTNLLTAIEQTGFGKNEDAIKTNTDILVGLLSNVVNVVTDVTERNTKTLKDLTKDVEGAKKAYSKGVNVETLKNLDFNVKDLLEAEYTPSQLIKGGYDIGDFIKAGIDSIEELRESGFSADKIKTALDEIRGKDNPVTASELKAGGFTPKVLHDTFNNKGITDADIVKAFDFEELVKDKFDAKALNEGGYSLKTLNQAGYDWGTLRGIGAQQFANEGFTYAEAKAAGFKAADLKNVAQYAKQAAAELQPKVSQGRDLAYGSQGSDVKLLQQTLNKLGIRDNSGNSLDVDGDFGQHTREAVINFQKKYRNKASKTLSADGVVGYYTKEAFKALGYKTGGLADYTGPAWLDGTPSKPELVLNATDTKNFLALRDVLSSAMKSTSSVANAYGGNATYEININVDKLTSDYDVDRVAERVKKIIVKDSSYRNVTQVRNFR